MEFIKGVIIVVALLMSIGSLLEHKHSHHEAAEIITLTALVGLALLEWMGALDTVTAADIGMVPCAMYLWGCLTEALSTYHKHFWLGYCLGIVGPVYVKVKDE